MESSCDLARMTQLVYTRTTVWIWVHWAPGFRGSSVDKEPTSTSRVVGNVGLIPGQEDPLEEGMAAHSSIFAWRIPRTEEPGGLLSMGSESRTQVK